MEREGRITAINTLKVPVISEGRKLVTVLEDGSKKSNRSKLRHKIRLHVKVYFLMEKGRRVKKGAQGVSIYHLPITAHLDGP